MCVDRSGLSSAAVLQGMLLGGDVTYWVLVSCHPLTGVWKRWVTGSSCGLDYGTAYSIPVGQIRSWPRWARHVCCPCTVLCTNCAVPPVSAETIALKLLSHLLAVLRLCILFSDPCAFIVNTVWTLVLEINFKVVVFRVTSLWSLRQWNE